MATQTVLTACEPGAATKNKMLVLTPSWLRIESKRICNLAAAAAIVN
ncbi:MAG: hypothetical protein WBA99_00270 [Nodosilinea sp.]